MSELKEQIEKLAKENGSILEGMSLLVDEINVLSARVDRMQNNRHEISNDDCKIRKKQPNCS
jgi:predicted RNase H-like nuclease (RuvC/YqgF family)